MASLINLSGMGIDMTIQDQWNLTDYDVQCLLEYAVHAHASALGFFDTHVLGEVYGDLHPRLQKFLDMAVERKASLGEYPTDD